MASRITQNRPRTFSGPIDVSPDGKAFRSNAAAHRVTCGNGAPLDDLTAFTAIIIVRASATMNGRVLLAKGNSTTLTAGWAIRQGGAFGALRMSWARTTTAMNYTTMDLVHNTMEFTVVVVTVDQNGNAGALVEVEYAPWHKRLRSATWATNTDGSGTYPSDSSSGLVIANTAALDNSAFCDYAFVGLWPKLTRAQRAEVVGDLLAHRQSSLGFWRPGHRGYAGRVLDESGNGHDGTQSSLATVGARSSIRGLWLRPWMTELLAKGPSSPQTVPLTAAIATAVAPDIAVTLGGLTVPLTAAVANATAQDLAVAVGAVPLTEAIATAVAQDIGVTVGGVTVPLTAAVATAVASDMAVALGGSTVPLTAAVATAVAPDMAVTLGGLTVPLTVAVANGSAQDLTVVGGGGATVPLTEAIAAAVAPDMVVALGGLTVPLTPAVATAVAPDIAVALGGLTVALTPAVATAVAPGMSAGVGRISQREHFASSLGAWTAVTAGDGTVTVTDSQAKMELFGAAASGTGIYRAFPHTVDHMFAACVRNAQNDPHAAFRILDKGTAPTCDTTANIDAIENLVIDFVTVGGTRRPRIYYRQPDGTRQFWNDATKAWTTTSTVASIPSGQNDSSYIYGYQWDATNSRVRLFIIGAGSGTTQIEACGPKLFALTDWIAFSSIRSSASTTLWTTIAKLNTDVAQTGSFVAEWTRFDDGPKIFAAANQATVSASPYQIKLWESYGRRFWLPSGASPQRTSTVVIPGAQPWCSAQVQMGAGIRENDGTLWLFFNGRSASFNSVGVTKSTDGGVTWTPFASNPIVAQQTGTNLQNCGNVSVIKDESEPDPNKRYKLFLSFSDTSGNFRIFLYTASAPESTWTQQGVLAAPDVDSPTGYRLHSNPIFVNGEWLLIDNTWVWRGPALALASLTKQAFALGLGLQNVSQAATSLSSTSRTVGVANSTGYVEDALVLIDDDFSPGAWALNRVRKNLSDTQFEMYERTPGYAPNAIINRLDAGQVSVHGVYHDPVRNEWCFYLSVFRITTTFNGGGAIGVNNCQTTGLAVSSGPLVAPTIDWFDAPQVRLARDDNTGTSENMKFFDPPLPLAQTVQLQPATALAATSNLAVV